jgi:pimeloyl-ACP methyl ester carboxylesterase
MTSAPSGETAGQPFSLVTAPDGPTVVVHEWGNPEGPEILLIHGLAQSYLCFERQCGSGLARTHRLVSYDVRGHGGSDKPSGAEFYTDSRRWADELHAVIESKQLRRPVLVGHSLGGRIIGQYLVHYGDRRLSGVHFVAARVTAEARFSGPAVAAVPTANPRDPATHVAMASAFLRACFHDSLIGHDFEAALAYNMLAPVEVRNLIRGWRPDVGETLAALRAIRVPTLLTHGRRDTVVLPEATEFLAATIPDASVSWYDECGHVPFWQDAPRFNRELRDFVAPTSTSG